MKNYSDTIGNRTRDLPACSAVPQPKAPPAACPIQCPHTILFSHLCRGLPSSSFSSGHLINISCNLSCIICATCPIHLILLNMINLITFVERHKPRNWSFYGFVYPSVTSSISTKLHQQHPVLEWPQTMIFAWDRKSTISDRYKNVKI